MPALNSLCDLPTAGRVTSQLLPQDIVFACRMIILGVTFQHLRA